MGRLWCAAAVIFVVWLSAAQAGPEDGTTFNILDYGAVPDDGNDDTGAIAAAIEASDPNAGEDIFIPAGVFHIASGLTIPSYCTVTGAGSGTSVIEYIGSEQEAMLSLTAAEGVEIAHLALRGSIRGC